MKLEGIWTVSEHNSGGVVHSDFSARKISFQFFDCEDAYTATCRGIYMLDFPAKTTDLKDSIDVSDTIRWDIKGDELAIKYDQVSAIPNPLKISNNRYFTHEELASVFTASQMATYDAGGSVALKGGSGATKYDYRSILLNAYTTFFKRRFILKSLTNSNLEMQRVDSSDVYIKATKN